MFTLLSKAQKHSELFTFVVILLTILGNINKSCRSRFALCKHSLTVYIFFYEFKLCSFYPEGKYFSHNNKSLKVKRRRLSGSSRTWNEFMNILHLFIHEWYSNLSKHFIFKFGFLYHTILLEIELCIFTFLHYVLFWIFSITRIYKYIFALFAHKNTFLWCSDYLCITASWSKSFYAIIKMWDLDKNLRYCLRLSHFDDAITSILINYLMGRARSRESCYLSQLHFLAQLYSCMMVEAPKVMIKGNVSI